MPSSAISANAVYCTVCKTKPATQFPKSGAVCADCAAKPIVKPAKKKWGR